MFFPRKFLNKKDGDRIIQSIKIAESHTSGEIRVHFQRRLRGDILERAIKMFHTLKMDETEARNGVLIFIAPSKRKFCIIGDKAINDAVPDGFWDEIKEDISLHFKNDQITEGLCKNIETIGQKLKDHFPYQADDKNELPDTISYA